VNDCHLIKVSVAMDDFVSALELGGDDDDDVIIQPSDSVQSLDDPHNTRTEFSPVRLPSPPKQRPDILDLTNNGEDDDDTRVRPTSRKRTRRTDDGDVQELVDLTDDTAHQPPASRPKITAAPTPTDQVFYFALPSTAAFLVTKAFDPDHIRLAFNAQRYPHSFGVGIETENDQAFVGYIDQSIVPQFSAILSSRAGVVIRVVPTSTPQVKPGEWQTITVHLYAYGPKALALKTAQRFPVLSMDNRAVLGDIIKPYFANKPGFNGSNSFSHGMKNEQEVFFKILDELQDVHEDLESSEPSEDLTTTLLEYQKKGLTWMIGRETNSVGNKKWEKKHAMDELYRFACRECFGGILADEVWFFCCFVVLIFFFQMGLGKTIQTISLILSNSRNSQGKWEGPTLIMAPLSVLSSWEDQIKEHSKDGALKIYVHHGQRRLTITSMIERYHIVLTTYSTLSQEFSENEEDESPLHEIEWFRVVLDEAHCIRSFRTKQAKATLALKSKRRWCLTGTPVQNRMDDLYGLLAFLRIEPFCQLSEWTRTISNPLKKGDTGGLQRLKILMSIICLRRLKSMKVNGKQIVNLPEKSVQHLPIVLGKQERQTYDILSKTYKELVGDMLKDGTIVWFSSNFVFLMSQCLVSVEEVCSCITVAAKTSTMLQPHCITSSSVT
jgi:hypothetical protein